MQAKQLESALEQKIQQIDNTRPYEVHVSSGWGEVKYNLSKQGMRGVYLVEATEEEILQWVRSQK